MSYEMKKIILLVGFIIFVIILAKLDPNLSFTTTGGISFENSTPPVVSSNTEKEVLNWFESLDKKPLITENPDYTMITSTEVQLQTYTADVEFYYGQKLSEALLLENNFPNEIMPIFYTQNEDRLVAVKVTYLDLTDYGITSLEKLISNGPISDIKNLPEYASLKVFEYNEYLIFLQNNILYYVLKT